MEERECIKIDDYTICREEAAHYAARKGTKVNGYTIVLEFMGTGDGKEIQDSMKNILKKEYLNRLEKSLSAE